MGLGTPFIVKRIGLVHPTHSELQTQKGLAKPKVTSKYIRVRLETCNELGDQCQSLYTKQ